MMAAVLLLIFLLSLWQVGPALQAKLPATNPGYTLQTYLEQIHVTRNGSVRVNLQMDVLADKEIGELSLKIPYSDGQSVSFDSLRIAEVDAANRGFNAIGKLISGELTASSGVGSYKVTDSGRNIRLRLNASIPKGSVRRLTLQYTVYQAARRYRDVGDIRLDLFRGEPGVRVKNMGLLISFEAAVLPDEKKAFRFFQRNNLRSAELLLRPVSPEMFTADVRVPNEMPLAAEKPLFAYVGQDIPAGTEIRGRLMCPSVWLSRLSPDKSKVSAAGDIIREEEHWRKQKLRRYEYRGWARTATVILLGVSLLALLAFYWANLRLLYKLSRVPVTEPPEDLSPGFMAYFKDGKINGRFVLATLYSLARKGFITLEENSIFRVSESILPDESVLQVEEKAVLHWFWELTQGGESLNYDEVDVPLTERGGKDLFISARVRNVMDVFAASKGWVPLPGEKKPKPVGLVLAALFFVPAVWLSWLGSFFFPLLLMVPAALFLVLAFASVKYTPEGYQLHTRIRAYEHYLAEIDRHGLTADEMAQRLDRDFVSAVALGAERPFLLNLRYVLPVAAILESGFLRRYGFSRVQKTIEKFTEVRGGLKSRSIYYVYNYIARRVDSKADRIQTAILKLNLRLFREE